MDDFLDDLPDLDLPDPPPRRPSRRRADSDCVLWTRVRCPQCGSTDCPVTNSNHVPIRYHKCLACGRNFKSVEENWRAD
jgi:DNA-directed RNA polymerase subunit RPC12/RpoP